MKRALRRYRQRVAKARRVRILKTHGGWGKLWEDDWLWAPKPWKPVQRQCMNEPNWWTHEMMIQPSRVRSNQQLQGVRRGLDSEGMLWPDYRKPHLYYW
jgi:hypothetical protein